MTQEEKLAELLARQGITLLRIYLGEREDGQVRQDSFRLVFEVREKKVWETKFFSGVGNRTRTIPEERGVAKKLADYPRKQGQLGVKTVTYVLTPSLQEVLECLRLDASCGEELFRDFCESYGHDEDSRKSLDTYMHCQDTAYHMRRMFRGAYDELTQILEEE